MTDTLLLGMIFVLFALMILGIIFRIGLFNMLASGLSLYVFIELAKVNEDLGQQTILVLVFFSLLIFNVYYAFGRKT